MITVLRQKLGSFASASLLLMVSMTIVNAGNYVYNLVMGRWLGPALFADVSLIVTLLLVITFLLSVFMIAQFLLARELSGQDNALVKLRSQVAELTQLLALERTKKAELELSLGTFTDELAAAQAENARLQGLLTE